MNSKLIHHTWLIFCAISAFFIVSCDDPDDIGLSLQEQDDILNAKLIDTVSVNTTTVLLNDINTSTVQVLLTGAYDDVNFGNIVSNAYFEILLSTENPDFGSNPICDSIKLFLDYNGYFYGDTTESQTLEVYKLTEQMDDDSSYTVNSTLNVDPTILGNTDAGFLARPNTGDSIIEISLSSAYGDEIIAASGTTNDIFVQTINGLSLRPTAGNYDGAVLGFLAASGSKVVLYYHNDAGNATYELAINGNSQRFNNIVADRSATALSGLTSEGDNISTSITSNQGYFQSGTGLVTKLTFPHLQKLSDSLGTIAINRAELIIYPVDGTINGEHDESPLFLTMYISDGSNAILENSEGTPQIVPNDIFTASGGVGLKEFNFDESSGTYKFRITQYVQDLIYGNQDNNGVFLVPTINSTRVSRCLFYDQQNLVNPSKAMKLLLYYTVLDSK